VLVAAVRIADTRDSRRHRRGVDSARKSEEHNQIWRSALFPFDRIHRARNG